ncbi:hypothetical protein HBI95_080270 [Parastagonospora nodorum]|nr:hypothetical protein HBI95_080270 [Parastagonospora nodorum]KAH5299072.1 hypothetical protein HBI12_198950 [Parastagonospora nodorum]
MNQWTIQNPQSGHQYQTAGSPGVHTPAGLVNAGRADYRATASGSQFVRQHQDPRVGATTRRFTALSHAVSHVALAELYPVPLGATNDEALEWLQLLKQKTTVKLDPQVNAFDYRILAIRTEERKTCKKLRNRIPIHHLLANEIVLNLARKADQKGSRTLGIITEPDCIAADGETSWFDLAQNKEIFLELNWYIVKNQMQSEMHLSFADRNTVKKAFSRKGRFANLNREYVGVGALRDRLTG